VFRLRGLADVLYSIGVHNGHQREEMMFLGGSMKDIALALERATEAQWAEWQAEDRKPVKRLAAAAKSAARRAAA
jgi:hypothetical protein